MKYDLNILACPCCEQQLQIDRDHLNCIKCNGKFAIHDGIPFLVTDPHLKTKLEDTDYDELHQVNPKTSMQLYRKWNQLFEMYKIKRNHVLEIGSGTGLLTYGFIASGSFDTIHISDISYRFLRLIMERMPAGKTTQYYYVCDANHLPFRNGCFNLIAGNSVLHHFLDYPVTLKKCYNMLQEGGIAVFTEPVREGHAVIALFNAFILELHSRYHLKIFNTKELLAIQRMSEHVRRHIVLGNDRKQLAKLEDKYIFSIREMETLGRTIGFKGVRYINMADRIDSPPAWGFREHYETIMNRQHKIPIEKIAAFDFIFNCFGKTFSDVFEERLATPFGFFVFEK